MTFSLELLPAGASELLLGELEPGLELAPALPDEPEFPPPHAARTEANKTNAVDADKKRFISNALPLITPTVTL